MTDHHQDDHQAGAPQEPSRKLTKAECGRIGGKTTLARHGRAHFVRAGQLGFAACARTRANGHRKNTLLWLREQGKIPPPRQATAEEKAAILRDLHARLIHPQEATADDQC